MNPALKFQNRIKELHELALRSKKDLPKIMVPDNIISERLFSCSECVSLNKVSDTCSLSGDCFISVLCKSPVLVCPKNKWDRLL